MSSTIFLPVLFITLAIIVLCILLCEIKIFYAAQKFSESHSNNSSEIPRLCFFIFKRFADIVISLLVCICILPLMYLVLTPMIKLSSKGPVIYKQKRVGLFGKEFICYKFRSMHLNNDPSMAKIGDKRITSVGRWMRKTHIDEFAQFYNVLKGDMSLVGPRPYQKTELDKYASFKAYQNRLSVRPGITGLAQINSPRTLTKARVLELDLKYLEKMSFKKDIFIFFETLKFKDLSY